MFLDDFELRDVDRKWLRNQFGVVLQDPFLFSRSIEENLRVARPDARFEELVEASRDAAVHNAISAFPDGYAAMVGERGVTLSGGQRQRVALARALVKDPAGPGARRLAVRRGHGHGAAASSTPSTGAAGATRPSSSRTGCPPSRIPTASWSWTAAGWCRRARTRRSRANSARTGGCARSRERWRPRSMPTSGTRPRRRKRDGPLRRRELPRRLRRADPCVAHADAPLAPPVFLHPATQARSRGPRVFQLRNGDRRGDLSAHHQVGGRRHPGARSGRRPGPVGTALSRLYGGARGVGGGFRGDRRQDPRVPEPRHPRGKPSPTCSGCRSRSTTIAR